MTLYLGNLSYRVRENDLEQLLSEFGEVSNARVVMDRATEGRRLLIREAEDRPRRERRF